MTRHCSRCGRTDHDRRTCPYRSRRTRRNPTVGTVLAVEYRRRGDRDPRPWRHEFGDWGERRESSRDRLVTDRRGRLRITGPARWTARGIVG